MSKTSRSEPSEFAVEEDPVADPEGYSESLGALVIRRLADAAKQPPAAPTP